MAAPGFLGLAEPPPWRALTARAGYPWFVVGVTCLSTLAGQIDASIVQLALPTLEREFAAPLDQVAWIAVAYLLGFASALPIFARLAETTGRKLMYLLGFALFGLASAGCGLAPDLGSLIACRAVQGISGAMLGANSVVILLAAAGPARRGRAMGYFSTAQAIGISVGPALGGVLLGALSWHWIFWVTVPLSALGAVLVWALVPTTKPVASDTDRSFDLPGALLLVPALLGLLTAIVECHAWGPLAAPTLACLGTALVLLPAFAWRELRAAAPLIDLRLFRSLGFSGGNVAIVLSYGMLYAMFFAMSFAMVRGYHQAPLAAGLRLTVVPVTLGLMAPISGGLTERRPLLLRVTGMALCVAAALALARALDSHAGLLAVMAGLAVYGAGLGLFIPPNNSGTLAAAPPGRSGQAGGLLNLMRGFGTATGVACASSLLAWRIELSTGLHEQTVGARDTSLLAATADVMLMLAAMAVLAGITSSLRGSGKATFSAISRNCLRPVSRA